MGIQGKHVIIQSILLILCGFLFGQTGLINVDENHTGHKIYNLPTPTDSSEAATKGYVDAHGGGGGSVSLTATSPIIVTPSPITGTGVVSLDSTSKTNWDLAFTQTRQWDGGSTGLIAGTGRTSLGLVIGTNVQAWDADLDALAALSGTNTIYYRSGAATWSAVTIGSNMTFSSGTLNSTAGGSGTVTTTGSPATGNLTKFSGATSITNGDLSGDVTTSGTLATTIANNTVTLGKMATMATDSILGRATASTGNVEVLTALPFAFTGDVTRPIDSNAQTIANSAVTYAKLQNVSANSVLLGSNATGSGAPPSEIALGTNLSMSGSTLNATGGGGASVANPGSQLLGLTAINGSAATALRSDGAMALDQSIAPTWTGLHTFKISDAATAATSDLMVIGHNSNGTAGDNFGENIVFNLESSTTNDQNAARMRVLWSTANHATRSATMALQVAAAGVLVNGIQIFGTTGGGLGVGIGTAGNPNVDGVLNVQTGLQLNGVATAGKMLQGDGSKYAASTPTWPTSAASSGSIVQANGTNFVASSPTWPTAAGTAGYTVRTDGTNFATYPQDMLNASTSSQATFSTSDIYIAGSNVAVAAGDFKAKGQYHCMFDMTKSAGTGAIVITLRVGTAGSTSDAAIQTYTFGAGTAVADSGLFDVWATFRTVGSGTSAVITSVCYGRHNAATTGLFNNAQQFTVFGSPAPSSGFATNAATQIGLSFNGSTAFAGTGTIVQAQLLQ